MGAHPTAPSGVRDTTLDALIEAEPERALGAEVAARFGGRLPFLLKVLSAARALSIQVHPSRAQAEAGYADENARGCRATTRTATTWTTGPNPSCSTP